MGAGGGSSYLSHQQCCAHAGPDCVWPVPSSTQDPPRAPSHSKSKPRLSHLALFPPPPLASFDCRLSGLPLSSSLPRRVLPQDLFIYHPFKKNVLQPALPMAGSVPSLGSQFRTQPLEASLTSLAMAGTPIPTPCVLTLLHFTHSTGHHPNCCEFYSLVLSSLHLPHQHISPLSGKAFICSGQPCP